MKENNPKIENPKTYSVQKSQQKKQEHCMKKMIWMKKKGKRDLLKLEDKNLLKILGGKRPKKKNT